jgi:hypothetical protein
MARKTPERYYTIIISDVQFSTIRSALNHSKMTIQSKEIRAEIEAVFNHLIQTATKVTKD